MANDLIVVVLDTNVFLAAYWSRSSASARLIKACMDGRLQARYSPEVKREITRLLGQVKVSAAYIEYLDSFWAKAQMVKGIPVDSVRSEDPDDQKFLEAAASADADYLITNDDHLLRIGYVSRAEILTPSSAVRILGL